MILTLGKLRSLKDLEAVNHSISDLRKIPPVAVIDDEPFFNINQLRQHGYDITELGDISDIKTVSEFDIVVCDIKGVGKAFGSANEGGHVIEEIRNKYPHKYIIAFSGNRHNASFKKYFDKCDSALNKDADIADWTRELDLAVSILAYPALRWKRIRATLLNNDIEVIDLIKLEQAYIKAVNKNNPSLIEEFDTKKLSSENKSILLDISLTTAAYLTKLATL